MWHGGSRKRSKSTKADLNRPDQLQRQFFAARQQQPDVWTGHGGQQQWPGERHSSSSRIMDTVSQTEYLPGSRVEPDRGAPTQPPQQRYPQERHTADDHHWQRQPELTQQLSNTWKSSQPQRDDHDIRDYDRDVENVSGNTAARTSYTERGSAQIRPNGRSNDSGWGEGKHQQTAWGPGRGKKPRPAPSR
jgi:hypothetical protein